MHSPDVDRFLDQIVCHILFPYDRSPVRAELEGHMEEKIVDYAVSGYTREEAEALTIRDMGDPGEIGAALNREHNPWLGWLWIITNALAVIVVFIGVFQIGIPVVMSLVRRNPMGEIPKADIVHTIPVNEKVRMDDRTIHFQELVYTQNGDIHILYSYYVAGLRGTGWSLGTIGDVYDDSGNRYFSGSGGQNGGLVTKGIQTVEGFSMEADMLIIDYDRYNRGFRLEIPLKAGSTDE